MHIANTPKNPTAAEGDAFVRVASLFFTSLGVGFVCVFVGLFLTWP